MSNTTKFNDVSVEKDTKIIISVPANFGTYEVLYQKWRWDGIVAESIIFDNQDIEDISKEKLMEEIKNSPLVKDSSAEITTSKGNKYTFFNFNFTQEE
jgi:hypothetical protein